MPATITLHKLRHPQHTLMALEWEKFRLAFEGGIFFKNKFLKKFSSRETTADFNTRRNCSHVPAHAKAAVMDIRNAIFKRMIDITRVDGPDSYNQAMVGLNHGVDGKGNSMNSFMGQVILPELLVIGRVGIYIDKPQIWTEGASLADVRNLAPYLYHYQAEDIFSWHFDETNMLDAVLLRDHDFTVDEVTGVINGEIEQFRLLKKIEVNGEPKVELSLFDMVFRGPGVASSRTPILKPVETPIILDLPEIPFVLMELDSSLMTDIADYQISLLNLASSDVAYALKSNFPFYTEQFAPEAELPHVRPADIDGTTADAATANKYKVDIGVASGRRYPTNVDRPAFIHPSAEPLLASLQLQENLKREIRQLVNLNLSNIQPVRASADSKDRDNSGLEGGLANIGLELEFGERNLGRIWWWYESAGGGEVTVKYPNNYSLRTDEDRRREAAELQKIAPTVPSKTFQKQTMKDITTILQGHKISQAELIKMHDEIDESEVIVTDPDVIGKDHEAGFVSTKLASELRGYPEGEAEQAAKDHAERAARIVAAQTSTSMTRMQARGATDMDDTSNSGQEERLEANDTTLRVTTEDRTRGEGQ